MVTLKQMKVWYVFPVSSDDNIYNTALWSTVRF